MSRAAPSHLATLLRVSPPRRERVSVPSRRYDQRLVEPSGAGAEQRRAASSWVTVRAGSGWSGTGGLLFAGSRIQLPEKSRSGSMAKRVEARTQVRAVAHRTRGIPVMLAGYHRGYARSMRGAGGALGFRLPQRPGALVAILGRGLAGLFSLQVRDLATAQLQRLRLDARIERHVISASREDVQIGGHHHCAMTAEERGGLLAKGFGECLAERGVTNQHVRDTARFADFEDRDAFAEKGRHVEDRLEGNIGYAEGNHLGRVEVDDGHNVGARLV